MVNEDQILVKASSAYIKNADSAAQSVPEFDCDELQKYVLLESDTLATIKKRIDKLVAVGYRFTGKDAKQATEFFEDNEVRGDKVMRNFYSALSLYYNSFIEIVDSPNTKKPKEMHVLETSEMEINANDHGFVSGYTQQGNKGTVFFHTKKCVHISLLHFDTQLWGVNPVNTLLETIKAKITVDRFIAWLYETNQFRTWFNMKKGNPDEIKDFIESINSSITYVKKPLITKGEIEQHILRKMDDFENILSLQSYYKNKILFLIGVTPIVANETDDSNRSTGDGQQGVFNDSMIAFMKIIEDEISNELLPRLGFEKTRFVFNLIDVKARKDYLEMAVQLDGMGANRKKLNNWLVEKGLDIPTDLLEEAEKPEFNQAFANKNAPSRKPKGKDEMTKVKTGNEASTRQEQLVGKSSSIKPDKRWVMQ